MSKAAENIGELVGGIVLTPVGALFCPILIGVGVSIAVAGIVGMLKPATPVSVGNTGLLPVQQPNALWRIQYGIFQAAAAIVSFIDGPNLLWDGSGDNAL